MAELLKETRLLTKEHFTTLYMPEAERENYGTKTGEEALQDKIVGFFFSASWCPPCQHFVPTLRDVYQDLVGQRQEKLEVVFVSMDRTKEEMLDYYRDKHGDWLALKFEDPVKEVLVERFQISVIPKLIVVGTDGELITSKGRKDLQDKGVVCFRAWHSAMMAAAKKAADLLQQQTLAQQQAEGELEGEDEDEDDAEEELLI